MTWNRWRSLNWWLGRSRRLVHIALLGLVHKRLHTGLHRVFHLLHHLLCIEGCTGCRWCGLRCHRCWWIRHWSWGLRRMWMERGLMKWKKLLKVLDMCLSLYSQLLIQDVILLSESCQLCLSLSLELSLWLLVHKITATKLTLKSHRLWVPEGPHVVGSGRIPSRKHGSTVRRFNKLVQTRCIHNSCKDRDKAQRPSVFNSTPSTAVSSQMNYMHNFNLTKQPKEKWPNLESMSCYLFMSKWLRAVSWTALGKEGVSMASNYAVALQEMVSARTAAHCSTIDIDEVKTEKKAGCSLYLDELLIQKCKFRHRVTVNC